MIGGEAFSSWPDARPTGAFVEARSVYRASRYFVTIGSDTSFGQRSTNHVRARTRRLFRDSGADRLRLVTANRSVKLEDNVCNEESWVCCLLPSATSAASRTKRPITICFRVNVNLVQPLFRYINFRFTLKVDAAATEVLGFGRTSLRGWRRDAIDSAPRGAPYLYIPDISMQYLRVFLFAVLLNGNTRKVTWFSKTTDRYCSLLVPDRRLPHSETMTHRTRLVNLIVTAAASEP